MATLVLDEPFETGPNGAVVTSSAYQTTGLVTYDSGVWAHGQYSAKFTPQGGTDAYLTWLVGQPLTAPLYGRTYVFIGNALPAPVSLVSFYDGAVLKQSIVAKPDGTLALRNYAGADMVASTPVWTVGAMFRLEWSLTPAANTFSASVYLDRDSTTASQTISVPVSGLVTQYDRIQIGASYPAGTVNPPVVNHDSVAIALDAAIGPAPPDPAATATYVFSAIGDLGVSTAEIAIGIHDAQEIRVIYAPDPGDGSDPLTTGTALFTELQEVSPSLPNRFALSGLLAGQKYVYSAIADGGLMTERHTFATCSRGEHSYTIAFSSEGATASDAPVFDIIRGHAPSFFGILGDLWSSPVASNDIATVVSQYLAQFTAGTGRFRALIADTPASYIWGTNDWGGPGSDQNWNAASALKTVYASYLPTYPLTDPDGGIYQTWACGRVQYISLDCRSRRSGASMLGSTQKAWLKEQLAWSGYPVKVLLCPFPWRANLSDGWGGFPDEFNEINSYIASIGAQVLVLSGGYGGVAADSGANSGGGIPNFMAGALDAPGLTQPSGEVWDEGYHANATGVGQFGLLEITDTGTTSIDFTFTGRDANDVIQVGPYTTTVTVAAHHTPAVNVYGPGGEKIRAVPRVWTGTQHVAVPVKVYDGTSWRTL